jgi:flagellar biosynthesis protein FlhF
VTLDGSLQALIQKQIPVAHPSVEQPKAKKEPTFSEQLQVATVLDPVTQHLHDMKEEIQRLRESQKDPEQTLGPLRQEIEGLRIVVGEVLGSQMHKRVQGLPGDLLEDYQALVGHGMDAQVAHQVLRSVVETLGTAGLGSREAVNELLRERMEGLLGVSNPSVSRQYGQKIMMLVGPTGVGKTTTIAKLAGLARQQDAHQRTVLITLDTYRVAAVEQLRVFAKILKIPLEVAVSQQDFLACVGRHQEADLVLIDTAGRSPKDRAGHEELVAMTRGSFKIETHLVLAAPVAESVQMETIQRYQTLPIHKIIMTKLDETSRFGSMYNVLSQAGIPVSYLSAGQRVPEDLEPATRQGLVELVLGEQPTVMGAERPLLAEVAH